VRYFVTYFDRNFLARALALHASLKRNVKDFRLYALCWDEAALQGAKAMAQKEIVCVTPQQLEAFEPRLAKARPGRSLVEYYFTCGPALIEYVFSLDPAIDLLTYLDADLFFFSDPEPVFDELGDGSVGLVPNRFAYAKEKMVLSGLYNVGFNMFRRDAQGLACLHWWKESCIEWCYDFVQGDRYADQKYLYEFPGRFPGVKVIRHPGADLAPWNLAGHVLGSRDGRVEVDGKPLIFFHFSEFREITPWLFNTNLGKVGLRLRPFLKRNIFLPYLRELRSYQGSVAATIRNEGFRDPLWLRAARQVRTFWKLALKGAYIIDWSWMKRHVRLCSL
jgi:hypothetical protein